MKKGSHIVTCTCCGTPITAPYFYDGKPFGSSCIKRQYPNIKIKRDNGLWLKADTVEFEPIDGTIYLKVTACLNGVKFVDKAMFDKSHYQETGEFMPLLTAQRFIKGNLIKIAEFANGTNSYWKHIAVNQIQNEKLKLMPLSLTHYVRGNNNEFYQF